MIDNTTWKDAVSEARKSHQFVSIQPYSVGTDVTVNEYCLFVKPELTGAQQSEKIFELIFERLASAKQEIVAAAAVDGSYLARHRVMEDHYGVINQISRIGAAALTPLVVVRLKQIFGDELDNGLEVLGGHQFMSRYPYFSAKALAVVHDNLENRKLGPGAHCVRADVLGDSVVILNGFHAEQLERYTAPGSAIVALVIRSDLPWTGIRATVAGSTHPAKADVSSIRGTLYTRQRELGLKSVTAGTNGVHVSAGPVEGMVEASRFVSDLDSGRVLSLSATTFGRLLFAKGLSSTDIESLQHNPPLEHDGVQVPVFDMTEEMNAIEAAILLAENRSKLSEAKVGM